jgi:hypothetical protein
MQLCLDLYFPTAAVQQNERHRKKETRKNRLSVVGMKSSVHHKEEIRKLCLVKTYILYAAAQKGNLQHQIFRNRLRMPIELFPTAKFITAFCF